MYPMNLFAMFPPFPRKDKVFVAMSFDERFDYRWEKVIQPAVQRVARKENRFNAVRIDHSKISDSIMTRILFEISEARLILADISSIGKVGEKRVRNGNVMYEVGLAHAVRLPEEVILIRSDKDDLLFDVQGIKVHEYSPDDDPQIAQNMLCTLMLEAMQQVELARSTAVKETMDKLDFGCWRILYESLAETIEHPQVRTMRDVVSLGTGRIPAILRLLDRGLLKLAVEKITPGLLDKMGNTQGEEFFRYEISEFGEAVAKAWAMAIGVDKLPKEFMQALEAKIADEKENPQDKPVG